MIDAEKAFKRLVEGFGGIEPLREHRKLRDKKYDSAWNQDTAKIGRVLSVHLAVEFFLTEFIQHSNPNLGPLSEARLNFIQKVELINDSDRMAGPLKPGLRKLNTIRNRIAHKLKVEIDDSDKATFLNIEIFRVFRTGCHQAGLMELKDDPLSVLEAFADFAASMFHNSCDPKGHLWSDALDAGYAEPKGPGD